MDKKPTYEPLKITVGKLEGTATTAGMDEGRCSQLGAAFVVFIAMLLVPAWASSGHADDTGLERVIIAKGSDTYVPYSFLDEEGKISGFNNELFYSVAEVAGLKAKIELQPWPIIRKEIESGNIDVLTGMYYTKERDKLVDFSVPHLIVKYSMFVRKDSRIRSLGDLTGKEIIVMHGEISHDFLKQKGIAGEIVETEDTPTALRLLSSGKHDCALLVRIQGLHFIKKFKIKNVRAVGEPFKPMKFCFAVREGDSELLARLNEGLFVVHETRKYDEIYNKWFGILEREAVSFRQMMRYAAFVLIPVIGLFLALAFWSWSLRRQVKNRTEQLNAELSQRKRSEEALQQSERELRIRHQINTIFLTYPDDEMYAEVLKVILKVIKSGYGTFGYLDEDGSFVAPAVSREIYWDKCNVPAKEIIFEKGTFGGIWGRAIIEKKTLIDNDGPFNTPKGHIPIENTMVTPILFRDEVISAIHIANKPRGYDEKDRAMLETMASQIASVLYARLERDRKDKRRKQAENALMESESALRSIFRAAPTGIGVVSNRVIKEVNDRFCKMTGYSREELLEQNARILYLSDEDYEYVGREKYAQISRWGTGTVETRFMRKDGEVIDVILSSTPINLDDLSGGVTFTALDITDRKRAEEALQEREHYFRSLLAHMHEDILVIDRDYRVTDVNSAFLNTIGQKREDVIGSHCYESSHGYNEPCDRHGEECQLRDVFDTGMPTNYRHQHMRHDGSKAWVDILLSPMKDEEGNVTHVIEAARDVTGIVQAEKAILESEDKYHQLFENERDAIMIFDAETGLFEDANAATLDLYGYTKDEFLKLTPEDISAEPEKTIRAVKKIIDETATGTIPLRYQKKKDGTVIPVEITSGIFQIKGRKKIIGAVRDISERIQSQEERDKLEAQLHQAERMEAIGTLAGGIAHDFNNILAAIMGYTELAKADMPEDSLGQANLDEVLTAGKRARDLVKQMLTFSRQSEAKHKPLEINSVVKEALKLLRASIPTTVEIRKDIAKESATVMADPIQIHQVLMNLCTNAAFAMREEGGILGIGLENIDIEGEATAQYPDLKPGPYVRLTVSDTGPGIEGAVKGRIFDPFFTTKGPGEGTGMGLSVVHGIVKSHGGMITVYSEPGEGTTFHVLLPRIEGEIAPEAEKVEPLPTGSERILFVDDEEALVRMGEQMLSRLGYEVVARTSSVEALEAFRTQPDKFDLVITDLTMPNMTGKQLARELAGIRSDIPVILCTGYSQIMSDEEAKSAGIDGVVMKPMVMRELAETIRCVLDQEKGK